MAPVTTVFEPADFSMAELRFTLEHLGESATVALHGDLPKGVNPDAIRPLFGRFTELHELSEVKNVPWCGYEPIKASIERFIAFQEKCLEAQALGEPRHPSAMSWDSTGAMHKGGIGSDSADKVRSELLPDGTRIPFAVKLVDGKRRSKVWGVQKPINTTLDKITDAGNGTFTCSICDKVVASYELVKGRRARNKAIKLVRDHCMHAKTEQSRHRAIANVPV